MRSGVLKRTSTSCQRPAVRRTSRACVAALLIPVLAGAQSARGSVLMPDSVTPAVGVLVAAINARGATAVRTVTSDRGQFSFLLPEPGRYEIRVSRIGFRPTVGPVITVAANDTARVRITLNSEPVAIAARTVTEKDVCRLRPDSGLMVARVWEEARKAILISQFVAEGAPLLAEWIQYDRTVDAKRPVVREQTVRSKRGPTTHAFVSVGAERLAQNGYVVEDPTGTEYYAPDADVLLSESFAATHCLRLAATPVGDDGSLVGVGFEPVDGRRDMRDVRGTFWLDRRTAELRTLEFRYTGLPDASMQAGAGGEVRFLRLNGGQWLISDWSIRMPLLGRVDNVSDGGTRRLVFTANRTTVRGMQVTGGALTRVTRNDSVLMRAVGAGVSVQVTLRDSARRVTGARLRLSGTDYEGYSDASGMIRLSPVLDGQYTARLATPLMDSLGVPPVERDVTTRLDGRPDTLALPRAEDMLLKTCSSDSVRHGEGLLRGTVRDEAGRAVPLAAVTLSWVRSAVIAADHLQWNSNSLGAMTGDRGEWRLCGVPRERLINVHVAADVGSAVDTVRLEANQPFGAIDLVARRGFLGGAPADLRATVAFTVRDADGVLLANSTLDVDIGGAKRTLVTGTTGGALLPDVPLGRVVVRARHVGYAAGTIAAAVAQGRNTVAIILSRNASPVLDTVRVLGGRRVATRLDEFETRRLNHEATASITAADIEKRNPVETWQMLSNVSSVKVLQGGMNVVAQSTRGDRPNLRGPTLPCYMRLMIDGVLLGPAQAASGAASEKGGGANYFDLNLLPAPSLIHGIEVFAGPSTIPLRYGGSGSEKWCGLIAVWTK